MRAAVNERSVMRPNNIHLACPAYGKALGGAAGGLSCPHCRRHFPQLPDGRRDFRPGDADVLTSARSYSPASHADAHADARQAAVRIERPTKPRRKPAPVWRSARALDRSLLEQRQPFAREMMRRLFNLVVRASVALGISDTQCGFRLFSEGHV